MKEVVEPQLVEVLKEGYSTQKFFNDLMAGVITGIVALPLAIAFAIASGVAPEQGIYTAIIAGFIISALGGSRVQIGGPTGAFIVIVYGIVAKYGIDGLALSTIMAGFILLVMGFARLGSIIKYIPYPVTIGFTSGIATIIAVTQVRDIAGLEMEKVPAEFIEKISEYIAFSSTFNPLALAIGGVALLILLLWPKVTHRVPGSIIAILVTTLIVYLFDLPVETIGKRFGDMPTGLPVPRVPDVSWARMVELLPSAFTIALLAAIESLLSAVVADGMTGGRHRSNMELLAQGVANIASPLFGGIPATGAIARTATNIKNGGRTPFAGIIHAVTLLLIMLFFGRLVALIPMASLAAVLLLVSYNMSEWRIFRRLLKSPRSDMSVLIATFLLTIFVDLTVAIGIGLVLASFLFMRRMEEVSDVCPLRPDSNVYNYESNETIDAPSGVEIYEIDGPFFFGAAHKFESVMRSVEEHPKIVILRMRHVPAMDATGLNALESINEDLRKIGTQLFISGVRPQPEKILNQTGAADRIGRDKLFKNIDDALAAAKRILDDSDTKKSTQRSLIDRISGRNSPENHG
ncbi:MAG: sulfate permease [Planctomycetota bacterium]